MHIQFLQDKIALNLILVDLEYSATKIWSVANVQNFILPITVFVVRIMLMYTCIYIANILFSRFMFNGTYWLTSTWRNEFIPIYLVLDRECYNHHESLPQTTLTQDDTTQSAPLVKSTQNTTMNSFVSTSDKNESFLHQSQHDNQRSIIENNM